MFNNFFSSEVQYELILCEKALVESKNKLLAFEASNYQIKMMNQNIYSSFHIILLDYEKPFLPIFNDLILNLMSGGIFNHWNKIFYEYSNEFNFPIIRNPQVLTMVFMKTLMYIFSVPLVLSLIAFSFEIGLEILTKRKKVEIVNVITWLD